MAPGQREERADGLVAGILQRGEQTAAPARDATWLTFLVADIRGYTTFTQERGDEAASKLTGKFAVIVRELVAEFDGTVFELRGDEALCVFASPRQCLRVAIALQQRFVEETASDPELPIAVGIGVDAGEAVHSEDGYRGGALNLAARLCGQAKGGQVLASPEVSHLAGSIDRVRYVPLERVSLKGLSEPIRPMQVLPEGEDPAQQIAALLAAAALPATSPRLARWLPGPLARRPRMTAALAALVLAAVVAGLLVFAVDDGGAGSGLSGLSENSVGVIDPANGHIIDQVRVDGGPTAVAAGFGSVWTANTDANTVSRIDTATRKASYPIDVGAAPSAITTGLKSVWVTNGGDGTVSRIDPRTNDRRIIEVGAGPSGITIAADRSVWVTNTADGTVSRIDPKLNKVVDSIPVGDGPNGIGAGPRDIWVANSTSNTVSKIDLQTHTVSGPPIHVANAPKGVVVVGGNVWVTTNLAPVNNVARIPTNSATITGSASAGPEPTQIAAVDGNLWVATQADEALTEIDPATTERVRTVPLGAIPIGLTAADGKLCVTTSIHPAEHHGGTIRIHGEDVGSNDPDLALYRLIPGVYDQLVAYRQATGADGMQIVPDLATAIPEPTNGDRTYTFHLRQGIQWSTGDPVTVGDVVRGIQRTIALGGNPGLRDQIEGAAGCVPDSCVIPGITADAAEHTVTITLVRPSTNFIANLTFSGTVPADTPLTQLDHPIPSTGPYQISRYVAKKLLVLTRNKHFDHPWSNAAQPAGLPDRIEWLIDRPLKDEAKTKQRLSHEIATGQTDWADISGLAPLSLLKERFHQRLHVTPGVTMQGISLNTRIPPFNHRKVRRALAYAIDRRAVLRAWFIPGEITCQFLPLNHPGRRPYCPYTLTPDVPGTWQAPDLGAGQDLLRGSPLLNVPVTVWTPTDAAQSMNQVVDALKRLNFTHAHLHVYKGNFDDYFPSIADSRNKVQAGFYGWIAGDASAENFLSLWSCDAITQADPVNYNTAQFCNHSIDHLMDQAASETSPAAANLKWARVDRELVDAAPWIPLVNPNWVDVVSTGVHNFKRSPLLGVLFDQMWVR